MRANFHPEADDNFTGARSNRTGDTTLRDDYTTNALNPYVTRENNTVPLSVAADFRRDIAGVREQYGLCSP